MLMLQQLATEIDKARHIAIPARVLWGFVFLRHSLAARPLSSSVPRMGRGWNVTWGRGHGRRHQTRRTARHATDAGHGEGELKVKVATSKPLLVGTNPALRRRLMIDKSS